MAWQEARGWKAVLLAARSSEEGGRRRWLAVTAGRCIRAWRMVDLPRSACIPVAQGVSVWISPGSPWLSGCGLAARGSRRILGASGMLPAAWMPGGSGVLWFDVGVAVTCRHAGLALARGGRLAGHFSDTEAWLQGDAAVAQMLLPDVGVGLPGPSRTHAKRALARSFAPGCLPTSRRGLRHMLG